MITKKKIIFFICVLIWGCFLTLVLFNNYEHVVIFNDNSLDNFQNNDSLAMMYETGYQSGEYQVSGDNIWPDSEAYSFNETLSKCENNSKIYWDNNTNRVIVETSSIDKCYVYFDKKPIIFVNYILNNIYTGVDGDNSLYHHDGVGTYGTLEAGDNSYRFSGGDPNNYVCFGSNEKTCPNDNLYRIIGVFDNQVKLIKYDYTSSDMTGSDAEYDGSYSNSSAFYLGNMNTNNIATYNFRKSSNIVWENNELNLINLNNRFLNYIGNDFANMIAEHSWVVRGNDYLITNSSAKSVVQLEVINPGLSTIYNGKIGLMYVSDYAYAVNPSYWNSGISNYSNFTGDNWMFMGLFEWTITTYYASSNVYSISDQGNVASNRSSAAAIRPTFYLNSNVTYIGGTGTKIDPYRIQ